MRIPQSLTRRPRPAAILTAGLAVAVLTLAALTHAYSGRNAGLTVGTPGCSVGVEWRGEPGVYGSCTGTDPDATPQPSPQPAPAAPTDDPEVTAFNAGWEAGVSALGTSSTPTSPAAYCQTVTDTAACVDGWTDGQADALGDDDRDGRVEPGESGWTAHHTAH